MTGCPSLDQLRLYLDRPGDLGADRAAWIDGHLESCGDCQATLDELTSAGSIGPPRPLDLGPATAPTPEPDLDLDPDLDPDDAWIRSGSTAFAAPASGGGPATEVGERAGRFRLEEKLGVGGFGVVYKARDLLLDCPVAIKVPRPGRLDGPEARLRFRDEARNAYALGAHKNLVKVLNFGDDGPFPYIVSEFCSGGSLAAWLDRQAAPVPPDLAASLVAELADGVQHAHDGGLLHRDIKPENIFLQPGRARTAAGLDFDPRLGDLGLARRVDAADGVGESPHGTRGSMAPEQTGGRAAEIGPGTDVYGLGALLYHLLAGRPPFETGDRDTAVVFEAIRSDPPAPIRATRPGTPPRLEAIALRALAKRQGDRYPTAAAFALDLRRFLGREPTRDSPWWHRLLGRSRRNPVRGAVAILLGLGLIAAYPAYRVERGRATDRALGELESVQLPSVGRVLDRLDPLEPRVAARLGELFDRADPRVKLAAAVGLAPSRADARDHALDRLLDGPAEEVGPLAPLLLARVPDLIPRLEREQVARAGTRAEREATDGRRANAAAALVLLGRPSSGYPLLRFAPDPQARSFLVHRLGPAGVAPGSIFDRLRLEPEVSIRRALILALGEVPDRAWTAGFRAAVGAWLLDRYEHDPDPGIHGAARWLIARPGFETFARDRPAIDARLAGLVRPGFGWRITPRHRLTLVRSGPIELADAEVTVGLYRRFDPGHNYRREFSPTDDHPIHYLSYDRALAFCRWLTAEEPPAPGLAYRPPKLDELIAASRAGATTLRFYGDSPALLRHYARHLSGDGGLVTEPCGRLKPNDLGLFHTLGNVAELVTAPPSPGRPAGRLLGGSVANYAFNVTCDLREANDDRLPLPHQGLRVVLAPAPDPR